jgi:predicted amidohydrolase
MPTSVLADGVVAHQSACSTMCVVLRLPVQECLDVATDEVVWRLASSLLPHRPPRPRSFGHSMIIDPWGTSAAQAPGGTA